MFPCRQALCSHTATFGAAAVAASLLLASMAQAQGRAPEPAIAADELLPPAARDYLLDGPWIYKATPNTSNLIAEDLNGDGRVDLAAVANDKSQLLVYEQVEDPLLPEERFVRREVALDRIIRSAEPLDVNGDGRMDLIMAASPPRLVVMYQDDEGQLQPPTETPLEADRVVRGDLTGDGRDDILVYRDGTFRLLPSQRLGLSLEPTQTFYTSGDPASDPMLLDMDGDGRNDVVFHDSERFQDLIVRLQSPEGTFPAEFRVTGAVLRQANPLPEGVGRNSSSVLAVQNNTRSLLQLALAEVDEEKTRSLPLPLSERHLIAFDPDSRPREPRGLVADVDGDGRDDLLVASPQLSSLKLLRQTRSGTLSQASLPTLSGIQKVAALPAEEGQPTPLLFFSPDEKAIGFATWADGQLPFPRILPVQGAPLGMSVAAINGDAHLVVLVEEEEGENTVVKPYQYAIDGEGNLGPRQPLDEGLEPFADVDVEGMEAMDVNRDGRDDLVVYADFQPAMILLQGENGGFSRLSASSGVLQGLLSSTTPRSLLPVQLQEGGPTNVLAVKENFARAFTIDEENNVVVAEQFNGRDSRARLSSAAAGNLRGGAEREVVLLDRGNKVLTVYGRQDAEGEASYEILANVELGEEAYNTLRLLDLDGDQRDDILLVSEDELAIIYSRPLFGGLETVATATTPVEDGGYGKVYSVDLLPAPGMEAAAIEMRENLLELFVRGEDDEGRPALHRFYSFKMFSQEAALARGGSLDAPPEPRSLISVDIDDDGRPEIATLMHDNLVVYYPAER